TDLPRLVSGGQRPGHGNLPGAPAGLGSGQDDTNVRQAKFVHDQLEEGRSPGARLDQGETAIWTGDRQRNAGKPGAAPNVEDRGRRIRKTGECAERIYDMPVPEGPYVGLGHHALRDGFSPQEGLEALEFSSVALHGTLHLRSRVEFHV